MFRSISSHVTIARKNGAAARDPWFTGSLCLSRKRAQTICAIKNILNAPTVKVSDDVLIMVGQKDGDEGGRLEGKASM